MGLTILDRPIGVGFNAAIACTVMKDSVSTHAIVVTSSAHGLSDGDRAYIRTYVENYNGFWVVDALSSTHFKLVYGDNKRIDFIANTSGNVYPQSFTHGWSCVELPIVYKLKSDRFPTNNFDTVRTINSYSEQDGYTVLNLSGSLPTDTLEYLEIIGGTDGFAGIYRILDMIDYQTALIDLKFTSDFVSLGHTVTKYYSNYHAKVNIYSGLNASAKFASVKPYELAATLRLVPDSNNEIKFSVSEVLKAYINISNNILLGTLPKNLDAFTQFYIGVIESYDNSDGYTVTTQESAEVLDNTNLEGFAVNAKLEFKNIQSGFLTDYIMNRATAKFLTLFLTPTLFIGCADNPNDCYYDMSFIRPGNRATIFRQQYYKNGALANTVDISLPAYNDGVYRQKLTEASCAYDSVQVTLAESSVVPDLSTFTNKGLGTAWTISSLPSVTVAASGGSKEYSAAYAIKKGTYTFNYIVNVSADPLSLLRFEANLYLSGSFVGGAIVYPTVSGDNTGTMSITLSNDADEIRFGVINLTPSSITTTIKYFQNSIDAVPVSETKTINIDCECQNQYVNLSWLNNLGGFEYFTFKAFKTYSVNISETSESKRNIFPEWGKSYGEFADTINRQTSRTSVNQITVNSQHITDDELAALSYIKSSILVEIINDVFDKRRVIVDKDSFVTHVDNEKLHTISFTITYTDDIPAQTV